MMDNKELLDVEIRSKLRERAEGLFPGDMVKERIDARIDYLQARSLDANKVVKFRSVDMKNKRFVKAAAIIGACLVLSGTTAYAVGRAKMWESHSTPHEYTNYGDLEKVEKRTRLELDLPESFENGYVFDSAGVTHNSQLDDEDNVINKFKSAYIVYAKEGEPLIHVEVEPIVGNQEGDEEPVETREIADGIAAEYDVHEMLVVPPDYEVSEEDREREENDPKFWISVGSDEVERKITSGVVFYMNGQRYSIMGFDLDMTADDMFEMAEEIVNR